MTRDTARPRIPLNTFAIGFGLAGLAEAWTAASPALHVPSVVTGALWGVAGIAWAWLLAGHFIRGRASSTTETLVGQLRHPAQGPVAALVPVTGMLLGSELALWWPLAGSIVVIASLVLSAFFAAWLIASWFEGNLKLEAIHGGYLLPTVAAGFVGAGATAQIGLDSLGWALFGIGTFFWVTMTTLLVARLALRASLPGPLAPTVAILVAPPAVAGLAWFDLTDGDTGPVAAALAGLTVLFTLVLLAMTPRLRRIPFSLGFWSFTFPVAAVAADAATWLALARPLGWQAITAIPLGATTALILAISAKSLMWVFGARGRQAAEAALGVANDGNARLAVAER